MGIKSSLQPSLTIIRFRCWVLPTAAAAFYSPPTSTVSQFHWSISVPQMTKLWACSLLEHSLSYFHMSSIAVTSCKKPSTTPNPNRVVAFLPYSHGSMQLNPLSWFLLCCAISTWSYLLPCLCYRIYKSSCICPGWLHVQNLPFTHEEHLGNILYNNKFSFSFSLIIGRGETLQLRIPVWIWVNLLTYRRTRNMHSFKDIILSEPSFHPKAAQIWRSDWSAARNISCHKSFRKSLTMSMKKALITPLKFLPHWKETKQKSP